jgi:hypothetical protein
MTTAPGASVRAPRVAIVGAGWAGLACAEALTRPRDKAAGGSRADQTSTPLEVTIIEAAPQPGGRARGLSWLPEGWAPQQALPIDNGQHLMIGAYTATQALLAQAQRGIPQGPWLRSPLAWAVPGGPGPLPTTANANARTDRAAPSGDQLLYVPSDAGCLRLLKSGFARRRTAHARPWPMAWQWTLAQTVLRAWLAGWTAQGTAEQWWRQQQVPQRLQDFFWKPLIEGALNTPFGIASAHVALRVLKDSLLGTAHSSDTLHPLHHLSRDAIDPVVNMLEARGVSLVTRCRVAGLASTPSVTRTEPLAPLPSPDSTTRNATAKHRWRLTFHPNSLPLATSAGLTHQNFDAVVLALPAAACRSLAFTLPDLPPSAATPFSKEAQRWDTVQTLGVTTLYAALTPQQSHAADLAPSILRPMPAGNQQVAMVLARPPVAQGQVIAAVASATTKDRHEETIHALKTALAQTLAPRLGEAAFADLPLRVTHEDQATWACTADHVDSQRAWGPSALGPRGLFRAADDLTPGYPACIESAVRGGVQTAEAVRRAFVFD